MRAKFRPPTAKKEKGEMGGDCTPTLAMILVQGGFAGFNMASKLALDDGMSAYVMIAYRQIIATIAFFLERIEKVGIRTLAGQAKVIGTVLCVGGTIEMTFYKESFVKIWPSRIHLRYAENMTSSGGSDSGQSMALGAALIIARCMAWAIWFIIQVYINKNVLHFSVTSSFAIRCNAC